MTVNNDNISRLAGYLEDIEADNLTVYSEDDHTVRTVDLGNGDRFEISIYGGGEFVHAQFYNVQDPENKIELSDDQMATLTLRF